MVEMKRISDATSNLWRVTGKIRSLGELFCMRDAEPPFSDEGIKGMSHLLESCADELDAILNFLEHGNVQPEIIRDALKTSGGIRAVSDQEPD